jgi:hypothetical protein
MRRGVGRCYLPVISECEGTAAPRIRLAVVLTIGLVAATPTSEGQQTGKVYHIGDALESGLVASLARPGGNLTGVRAQPAGRMPVLRRLEESSSRQGFFEAEAFAAVRRRLSEDPQVAVVERSLGRIIPALFPHLTGRFQGKLRRDFRRAWATEP